MTNESATSGRPPAVDRAAFQAELDKLRAREKAHTREGDAIAAAPPAPADGGDLPDQVRLNRALAEERKFGRRRAQRRLRGSGL